MAQKIPSLHDRLIDCALEMLGKGEGDISLRAVARATQVSAMAPYRHFADKAGLMAAVALRGFALLEEAARTADSLHDPAEALIAQGMNYIVFARDHPALFRLMFADNAGLALPQEDCQGAYALMASRVHQIFPDQAEAGALACWGMVHGLATLALDGRLPPDPQAERAALQLLVGAIGKR